jgi:type I restriction enzyme S subunit
MSKWKLSKLGDISEMCLGKMLDKEKNKGEFQPYLANINVRWGSFDFRNLNMMRFEKSERDRYGLQFGDLIICEGGEPGRCAIWTGAITEMKIQKALHRVRVKDNYSNQFVYYRFLLAGRNGELEKHFIGSTIKHLTGSALKQVEFTFPSLNDQQKIASVLSVLDSKIEINNRINVELEAMAKTLYDYWFVQFDFPDKDGKPYKSSGGKMVYNDMLKREIPDGWINAELSYVCDLYQPKTISEKEMSADGEYLVYGANGIVGRYNQYNHESSVVTITCRGNSCGAINITRPNSWITGNAMVVKPKLAHLSIDYLYQLLAWADASTVITGSAQPQITQTNLAPLKIISPDVSVLEKFKNITDPSFILRMKKLEEIECLTQLRDWLLPMLMNGQVQVTPNH